MAANMLYILQLVSYKQTLDGIVIFLYLCIRTVFFFFYLYLYTLYLYKCHHIYYYKLV